MTYPNRQDQLCRESELLEAVEVMGIEECELEDVYDLNIPKHHNFVANGFVISNCGEQPLINLESCNLGSINISKFVKHDKGESKFSFPDFKDSIHIAVRFLDNVIDVNNYPLPEISEMSKSNRKIGLGLMGLSDTLYELDIPYNSNKGVEFTEKVMKFLQDESHKASEQLVEARGCFPNWKGSEWEKKKKKMRNACTTTIAPTGSISMIASCSCGIEPLFSLAFMRNVLNGRKLIEVNSIFEERAKKGEYYSDTLMERIIAKGTVQGDKDVPTEDQNVFVCAHDVTPEWHLKMQASCQKHCDSAVSKTINLPHSATIEDIDSIYREAYKSKCKGVTVYRDGSRNNQPMSLKGEGKPVSEDSLNDSLSKFLGMEEGQYYIKPMKMPIMMSAISLKQATPFGKMHVKIVLDTKTWREREVFAQLGKGGEVATSDIEAICRMISLHLRCNGSLEDVYDQLEGIGSSLSIPTRDGNVASLADALAKAIKKYKKAREIAGIEALLLGKVDVSKIDLNGNNIEMESKFANGNTGLFMIKCPTCNGVLIIAEGCKHCPSCGYSQCG